MKTPNFPSRLLELMFPRPLPTPEELELRYPERPLKQGAIVTRFAPSPTGSMHIGGVYIAMLAKDLAKHSDGVYFVRIEDTDQERFVEGAIRQFEKTFAYFDIGPEEDVVADRWGPYVQSERADIYQSYIKRLVQAGRAYPCFCTKEELETRARLQIEAKVDPGYYGAWAPCRELSAEEVHRRLSSGLPYVVRFKSLGSTEPIVFDDLIRGRISGKDNINDVVVLKSSSSVLPLPTYHLAHAVDDHLMRVNLVLRSDEWISSVPLHLQLFDALEFERIPYAHISPLMKTDGSSRRKLSKRKDPEASVSFYMEQGYPAKAVSMYLRGIANSKLQDVSAETSFSEPIRLDGISKSGALLDMRKLDDIASNFIATLNASEIRAAVAGWALDNDPELHGILCTDPAYADAAIDTDRFSGGRVRKDLKRWSDFRTVYGFFFDALFEPAKGDGREQLNRLPRQHQIELLQAFLATYREAEDNEAWMSCIADIASTAGFARNNNDYKADVARYRGSLTDAIQVLRIVVTGRSASPSLFEVMKILGPELTCSRIRSHVLALSEP